MPILARFVCSSLAVLAILVASARAQAPALSPQDREALAEFDQRVKHYAALRDKLDEGGSELRETKDAATISAARQAFAAKIRAHRAGAKPGDIFTPAIQQRFRKILAPEMKGQKGRNTKGSIWDEGPGPGAIKLEVNGDYPKEQPLGTVPPNVLQALPQLPEGVEFRFVYRHLALRDAEANLIIDFMPAAIPAK